jgi:hypothetical protein
MTKLCHYRSQRPVTTGQAARWEKGFLKRVKPLSIHGAKKGFATPAAERNHKRHKD